MLQELAAQAYGGSPESYKVEKGRVVGNGKVLTFAQAGKKAIELGGKFDGHEPPAGINAYTRNSVLALAGQGMIAAARDNYPHDGQTQGEITVRGNVVMKGYYEDADATATALRGGYFHSGDAAVVHPDGYAEIRDRLHAVAEKRSA